MSDTSQGPGWWQASDGKWYPPEQAPGATPTPPPGAPGAGGFPPGGPPPGGFQPAGAGAGGGVGVGDIVGYSWKKLQEHFGGIAVAVIVYVVVVAAFSILGNIISTSVDSFFGSLLFSLVQLVVTSAISIVLIRASLMIVDGQTIDTANIFSADRLGPYMIGAIIFGVGVSIGLLLCIIPGLILLFLGYYWGYFVVDKGLEPIEAIKASIAMVRENVGTVLPWAVVAFLITIVGFILCCVGLLVAAPLTYIGNAYLFRRLNNEPVAA